MFGQIPQKMSLRERLVLADRISGVLCFTELGRGTHPTIVNRGRVGRHVDHVDERFVAGRAVVALEIVLGEHLPIRREMRAVPAPFRRRAIFGGIPRSRAGCVLYPRTWPPWIRPKDGVSGSSVTKRSPSCSSSRTGASPTQRLSKSTKVSTPRPPMSPPSEAIGPGMIGADDRATDPATPGQQGMRPMLADIVECPARPAGIPDENNRIAGDVCREVVTRCRDLRLVPNDLPCLRKDPPLLVRKDCGVVIEVPRKRERPLWAAMQRRDL